MKRYVTLLFLLVFSSALWAQNDAQKKLEERKAQLLQEIRINEKLLSEQKNKEKSVVSVILQQNAKINLREKLIATTEKQTKLLSDDIYKNQLQINRLTRELHELKEDYAKMIEKSYKSRSEQSRAMFLLSSNSFLQAYKRAQYMKQYASYRKSQGDEIKTKSDELALKNQKLSLQKNEKESLIKEQEKEKLALEQEKKEQEKLVNSIKKDQKKIVADIKKMQQETAEIDRKIQQIIRAAIAEANKKTAKLTGEKTVSTGTSSTKFVLTPEGKIISNNFKANKGSLPWPVNKGFVSVKFGSQPHPVVKSTLIQSSGIEITTEEGSYAMAVFEGEVVSIQIITPIKKAVYVQHGDFITVYHNLSSVVVNKGDKVKVKQTLGRIHTDGSGRTTIRFSVLQNDTFLNPQLWLSNM